MSESPLDVPELATESETPTAKIFRWRRHWLGISILAIFAILVARTACVLKRQSQEEYERHLRPNCQSNLKQIWICCKIYADEHDGQVPLTLNDLECTVQISDGSSVFICPASSDKVGDPSAIDSWSSYEIVYHGKLIDDDNLVIVQEKNDRAHRPGGRNYLFGDGHVSFKPTKPLAPTSERQR